MAGDPRWVQINVGVGPPRGIVRRGPLPGTSRHVRHVPSEALRGFVEHFWYIAWDLGDAPPYAAATLQHPSVHFVFEEGVSRVVGVMTKRFETVLRGRGRVFGVKFRPGGFRPWLGRAVATITDRRIDPADVFGPAVAPLEHAIAACDDELAMIEHATAFLCARMPPPDATVERVAALAAAVASNRAITRVEHLRALAGLDTRALQRLFRDYVGVSPKWVINRYRLHEALEQIAAGDAIDWAALALDLGYFDQAHFIRDFRRLVGVSPAAYARTAARICGDEGR
ncbi:MAG TPA: helix-turn-helix domain-containing protein [Xanthomonadales bacterium]|nr:helix-turn-helix domain-containing protein [Xanthomonadales bacterium]